VHPLRLACAALSLCCALPLIAAATGPRNDYTNPAFTGPLSAGLRAFYQREFANAQTQFNAALAVIPDNTLAIAFLNATAAQTPGELDALIDREEDALAKKPKDPTAHVLLGFSYMFSSSTGRNRDVDAREELNAAVNLDPASQAAHTGLGIMRENERSANRAKTEFVAAMNADPQNVLAREYLAEIYQIDLKDPQRALALIINVPNLVPDYADIEFHLASVLEDLKQYDAAVEYATRGLQMDIGHVGEAGQHGYTLLARVYLDQKKLDDARRVLHASITAGTDVAYANTLLNRINAGDYGKPESSPSPAPKK